ncbi:rod shape-determining protein MreC [Thomasclavelia ramosa]|uniref:rod shape-determining protein MreC n=1 Tax=Thomasclavelia ramosa TaxID=1547 RepID=UPI0022E3B183|nr:rod shape-determining protein MreC [Thomasclavelia ramosa]
MNNRKKQRNKRIVLIITVAIVVFSTISLVFSRTQGGLERMVSDSIAAIEYYVVKKPVEFVSNLFSEYNELKDVYKENKILKAKLSSYASVEVNTDVLSKEIDELKKMLNIEYLPTDYNVKTTSFVRESDDWNNEITIDLGSLAGVSKDMVVISSKGIIGKVTSVTEVTARVQLLTAENPTSALPIQVINGDQNVYGLLNRYDIESKCFEITLFSDVEKFEDNAKVITSGLGGKAPKGIYIGTVESSIVSEDGTSKTIRVKPAADFNDLSYVAVVFRSDSNE